MGDIDIHWAEFEPGQEPQDAGDDDFATSFDVEFTLRGRTLARLLGVQMRVLDRAVARLDGRKALRLLKNHNQTLDAVIKAVAGEIKGVMVDHAFDIGAEGVAISVIEPHTDGSYWEASVDKRKGEVKYQVQFNVLGDWDSHGRGKYASADNTALMARRVAIKWTSQRQALHIRRSGDVANTILQQLGGSRRLSVMLGAKHFLSGHKDGGALGGLSFQFPRPSRGKPNFVKILLMPDDTYTVEFGSRHGYNYKVLKKVDGIYADQVGDLFQRVTGLRLSL
jgi:hypothetical protein